MSSMIPTPPPRIQIGGGAPAGPSGPGAPADSQGDSGPDMEAVRKSLQDAIDALTAAQQAEGDDADAAQIAQIIAKIHTLKASHQTLADQAMGAGPGVKLMRKSGGSGGGV
jgi:hypothetical protein